jgi:hypothetical protein
MKRKDLSGGTYRERVAKSYEQLRAQERAAADFSRLEPLLKKSLLAHMVSRTPIRVERPMGYLTEELRKAQPMDEIDRAYYRQDKKASEDPGTYEVVQKAIEPGTMLTFVRLDQAMGQWIFKSSTGETIEIYDKPTVAISKDRSVPNPGFWGLLTSTNIYSDLVNGSDSEE